jgi:hypothetical protein
MFVVYFVLQERTHSHHYTIKMLIPFREPRLLFSETCKIRKFVVRKKTYFNMKAGGNYSNHYV